MEPRLVYLHARGDSGPRRVKIRLAQWNRGEDGVDNGLDIIENIIVCEPEHAEPSAFEPSLSARVLLEPVIMAAAVEFDHDTAAEMNEINDVTADGNLPSKFFSSDAAGAKRSP